MKSAEPTLTDVLEAVQTGFKRVDERFEDMDERFDRLEDRVGEVEYRMTGLEKRMGSLANTVEDMREELGAVAEAHSKDSEMLIGHDRRIVRLEKAAA